LDDQALAGILSKSLALVDAGEDIDSVVARFPEAATVLTELLGTANALEITASSAVAVPHQFLLDLGAQLRS
jgi:hypothetical protein